MVSCVLTVLLVWCGGGRLGSVEVSHFGLWGNRGGFHAALRIWVWGSDFRVLAFRTS